MRARAVGDGVGVVAGLQRLAPERARGVVPRLGLHADHLAAGREMRRRDRAARDKAAAAHRDEQIVELAGVLDQLLRRRPLPSDYPWIVERRNHGEPALARHPLGDFLAGLLALVVEHDLGAVAPRRLDLYGG